MKEEHVILFGDYKTLQEDGIGNGESGGAGCNGAGIGKGKSIGGNGSMLQSPLDEGHYYDVDFDIFNPKYKEKYKMSLGLGVGLSTGSGLSYQQEFREKYERFIGDGVGRMKENG